MYQRVDTAYSVSCQLLTLLFFLQISVCQMQETSPGKFQKCGAVPIEVEASKKDTYKCLLA